MIFTSIAFALFYLTLLLLAACSDLCAHISRRFARARAARRSILRAKWANAGQLAQLRAEQSWAEIARRERLKILAETARQNADSEVSHV